MCTLIEWSKHSYKTNTKERYADDTVVIAENEEQLQTLMEVLAVEDENMGLSINTNKSKTLVFSKKPNKPEAHINLFGNPIGNVTNYIY